MVVINVRLLALCNDFDFDSTSYALRENRYLKGCSGTTLWSDLQNGTLHFQDFSLIAFADHPNITKSLRWTIKVTRKKGYWVDWIEMREQATKLNEEYRLTPKIPFNDIVEHLALNHLFARLKFSSRIEKRKNEPFLCVYKDTTLLTALPLGPIELAWLAIL